MAVTHVVAIRDALADLVVDSVDAGAGAGYFRFDTSGDVEVATCAFSDPAFDDAGSAGGNADGVATANAISDDTSATGGTVAKGKFFDSNNVQKLTCSVTATGGGGDVEITSTAIGATDTVSITSLTYAAPP